MAVIRLFAGGRGRWLAAAASITVSIAMFHAQSKDSTSTDAATLPATAPTGQAPHAVPGAPNASASPAAELLVASAPLAVTDYDLTLSPGRAPEEGLQVHTIWAARAISMMFLDITTIGGFRQDPLPWHPNGLAIDVMIPNHNTPEGIELGNQIAGYALANAKRWGVLHVIWRQGFYPGIGAPSWTADYGNETANHFDHVHIATDGGGYPTGQETYYLTSMRSAPQN